MCKAILISEVVINRCIEEKLPLNTSKLQKILYYMQKEHLKEFNIPVFDEPIVAWECGPAISEINEYYVEGKMGFESKVEQSIVLKESHEKVLDIVLSKYGQKSPLDVAKISQQESAWLLVWDNGKGKGLPISCDIIMPPSDRIVTVKEESDEAK